MEACFTQLTTGEQEVKQGDFCKRHHPLFFFQTLRSHGRTNDGSVWY